MALAAFTPLDLFQLTALACFLFAVLGRSLRLRLRQKVKPITLSLRGKGLQGLAEITLFVVVNLWVAVLLWTVLPRAAGPLPGLLAGVLSETLLAGPLASAAGVILIAAAFAALWRAPRSG
jgi:hypothetical protein